jgi:hypothetical protein
VGLIVDLRGDNVCSGSTQEVDMLLVLAIILLILFAGLGFAAHVLWWGLILGLVVAVAAAVARRA